MKSIRLELQHMWADHDKKNWAGGTIEYTPNQTWSVFLHDMYNYGNDIESQRLHYYNFGGAYSKGATRIAASYGRQRGGMICDRNLLQFLLHLYYTHLQNYNNVIFEILYRFHNY